MASCRAPRDPGPAALSGTAAQKAGPHAVGAEAQPSSRAGRRAQEAAAYAPRAALQL